MSNNIVLNKYAYASNYVSPFAPQRAVDGQIYPLQRWVSAQMPCWLAVDLGDTYWIDKWVVCHMGHSGWMTDNYNMSNYKLQGSLDNATWFDIDTVTRNSTPITNRPIPMTQTRFVRVYVTKGLDGNKDVASIGELSVYGTRSILSDLKLKAGRKTIDLNPEFHPTIFQYSANASDLKNIAVTPTVQSNNATITVNGETVISGEQSSSIELKIGQNIITVIVKSPDNDSRTYTVNVTRES